MKILLAAAQYPITAFPDFLSWKKHADAWVSRAARRGGQLLLFPEYGAMELTNLLPPEEQVDLRRQVVALERLKGDFLEVFAGLARHRHLVIVAPGFPVTENGKILNRTHVLSASGLAGYQDKLFMTRFEDEIWGVQAASPALKLFEADWGAFGIQTCYDVEFPIGAHALCAQGAVLILAPSCTESIRGAARVHTGARARALENQCYTAVAQTVGNAPWSPAVDINYGYAAIYCPPDLDLPERGIVARKRPQQPGWLVRPVDLEKTAAVRAGGQVFNFKDQQRICYSMDGQALQVVRCRL
jgi:predicted amidohydrolase